MKYPVINQASEEDCGVACLATIAKYYGKTFSLNRITELVGTGKTGTTPMPSDLLNREKTKSRD